MPATHAYLKPLVKETCTFVASSLSPAQESCKLLDTHTFLCIRNVLGTESGAHLAQPALTLQFTNKASQHIWSQQSPGEVLKHSYTGPSPGPAQVRVGPGERLFNKGRGTGGR